MRPSLRRVLASRLLVDLAGAELTGSADANDGLPERPVVTLRPERASALIGLDVPAEEQRSILERLDFDVDDDMARDGADAIGRAT